MIKVNGRVGINLRSGQSDLVTISTKKHTAGHSHENDVVFWASTVAMANNSGHLSLRIITSKNDQTHFVGEP